MKSKANQKLVAAIGLTAILALGAFLRFYRLGADSIGNTYYAAAVKSMLSSWSNFFYVAFEPGGSVTVDKPPLGFWVQAASAYVFGVNGFALALPQALAGTLSIAVLYHLVRKYFGVWSGLTAALVLALTPITIATERNNTIDGLLVFVLLLAAWAFLVAAERGKFRYLLLGAFLVGLGFNIKMLQAYMALPAFYTVYLLGARTAWWKRMLQLGAATVVLLVVSFAWVAAVDLTPADQRPFIGSSENNTVLELIIGHNGLSRLGLSDSGPRDDSRPGDGGPNPPQAGSHTPGQNSGPGAGQGDRQPPPEAIEACDGFSAGDACTVELLNRDVEGICRSVGDDQLVCVPQALNAQAATRPSPPNNPSAGTGRGINGGETGSAGVLRLFQEPLVTEMSWLLPLVILGLPLMLVATGWSWPLNGRHNSLILWVGWLLPAMAYFSFTTGLFHRYYLIMLGPPLAALVGIAFWAVAQLWKENHWVGWLTLVFLSGLTVVFDLFTIRTYPDYALGVTLGTLALWLASIGLLILKPWPQLRKIGLAMILAALLVAALTWSVPPLIWASLRVNTTGRGRLNCASLTKARSSSASAAISSGWRNTRSSEICTKVSAVEPWSRACRMRPNAAWNNMWSILCNRPSCRATSINDFAGSTRPSAPTIRANESSATARRLPSSTIGWKAAWIPAVRTASWIMTAIDRACVPLSLPP